MANSQCTSCGLIHQHCQCSLKTSTTTHDMPDDGVTPAFCCCVYFATIGILFFPIFMFVGSNKLFNNDNCYIELFADSVSVSNTNVSAADWTMGLVATSPVTDCKFSLHTLKSRLLRGDQVISNSSSPSEIFGEFGSGNKPNIVFEKVVMPEVTGDVVWDYRVETWFAVNTRFTYGNGFLMATCSDISVKFTGNTTGNVTGSLLGNRRRCDYIFQEMLA